MNRYQITDIIWETDGHDEVFLPTDIDIPDEVVLDEFGNINYDAIDKYLSGITGFLHNGYLVEDRRKRRIITMRVRQKLIFESEFKVI